MTDNLLEADPLQSDPNKNYYEELVGEGKKFKTNEDLAKSKYHADQTIEVFKRQMDELRADYMKLREENVAKAKLEELIDQMSAKQSNNSDNTQAKELPPQLDLTKIENLVSSKIESEKIKDREQANFNVVKNKLTEQFGTNYAQTIKQRSAELGLSDEDVNALAKKSPAAFLKTFGLDQQQEQESFRSPPRSSQRNDNFAPKGNNKRTWSYYQEIYKANPQAYYDRKISAQMAKDAVELGEAFRDGDYYVRGLHDS